MRGLKRCMPSQLQVRLFRAVQMPAVCPIHSYGILTAQGIWHNFEREIHIGFQGEWSFPMSSFLGVLLFGIKDGFRFPEWPVGL